MTTNNGIPADVSIVKRKWRIRSEKNEIFGPTDLETLRVWARDGRIAPTSEISEDGTAWRPVIHAAELEMDWIAEVTSGNLYGPVHRVVIDEMLRDGSLTEGVALFKRFDSDAAADISPRERELEDRLHATQQSLFARIGELESVLVASRSELDQARASLSARDLEFDAERQELRAAANRIQADLVKRDGRIGFLEKEMARLEQAVKDRHAVEIRLSDTEKNLSAVTHDRDQERRAAEQARQGLRDAEKAAALLREHQAATQHDLETQRNALGGLRLRLDSIRKLLQQAAHAAETADETREQTTIGIDPHESVGTSPPMIKALGSGKPGLSPVELDAQSQHELRPLRQTGGKGGPSDRTPAR